MSEELEKMGVLVSSNIRDELENLGFKIMPNNDVNGVMWGFDGKTKYFPRDTYIRESIDGKPSLKLSIEKTTNGFTLIINSNPFKQQNHLRRSELSIEEIMPIVKEYLHLLR
ncbi:MAG: hypothetical protein QXY45_01940 [Candidatus Aenigmatarchaeota archaeon]